MWADDAKSLTEKLVRGRAARYQYDVHRFERSADGEFYRVELMSPEHGKRDIYLTVFWDAVRRTYQDGELARAITLNLDDAVRHIRGSLLAT